MPTSPPKPWEQGGNTSAITSPSAAAAATTTTIPSSTFDSVSDAPAIPTRSTTALNQTGAYGTTGLGASSYGGYGNSYGSGMGGYGSSYGSGYGSGYGGYGSSMYGSSYGGYGGMNRFGSSMYGSSYGGGMYGGMNRFGGGGMYGNQMGGPNGEMPLTQRMEAGTRPAFEVIEQIVGAFGGFAQMLDSTFMATHSSFMAMMGMAEQLGFLRSYLGQVFSVFALYRLVKKFINKALGRVEPGRPGEMNFTEFQQFENKATKNAAPKISKKPILIFLFMVVGLPYLMHKLIQLITHKQQLEQQKNPQLNDPMMAASLGKIDPAKLEFARATYDFTGESQMELSLKKGDIVAILSKTDPVSNQQSQWWRGRLRDGRMGMFPANYVEIVQKAGATQAAIDQSVQDQDLQKPQPVTSSLASSSQ
ncbi:Peroxin 13, N-terminal region-domain-containing protein [Circinella umbellata]|nr:Peroxin 13, N-terminal region-domain-containing protein [Circinella umbellata]